MQLFFKAPFKLSKTLFINHLFVQHSSRTVTSERPSIRKYSTIHYKNSENCRICNNGHCVVTVVNFIE